MAFELVGRETFEGMEFAEDAVFDGMTFCTATSFRAGGSNQDCVSQRLRYDPAPAGTT